ncbi:Dynein light chain Tctex-type 1 [Gracilariopsis chorda]|uniref:Dynein light chain Tctex-type 1 n=1 Tax=Gracilariopsis chorda TaxID=448386 RepID=A0A2V3J219_9FLOR|nr:Dynein light chain Tctex-type 1 [Gracilariopsis chorda]|eukprot:PXF48419.1 Dynein light chain Tctex-type 1 [Gracilariopsis chorda]
MATANPNGPDSPTASNKTVPHDSAIDNALLVSHNTLDEDFIKEIVEKAVDDVIQDATYSHDATNVWANKIAELLVRTLVNVDRDNKYIVTSMIVQNLRQGMRSATSCFWNAQTDNGYSLTREKNGMYVITTVFICKA